jgi:hypothetical protein
MLIELFDEYMMDSVKLAYDLYSEICIYEVVLDSVG